MQEWYRSRALYEASLKLLNSGKIEDALKMAEEIPDKIVRSKALSNIAVELARSGKEYQEALTRALSAALDIGRKNETTKALMALAFDFLELGKIEDAMMISGHITDLPNRSKVEAEIALYLAKRGRIDEAMKIINGILDEDVKTWATSMLANEL